MHIVAEQKLGLPQTSRDAFDMLHKALIIDENTAKRLKAMAFTWIQRLNAELSLETIQRMFCHAFNLSLNIYHKRLSIG